METIKKSTLKKEVDKIVVRFSGDWVMECN